MDADEVVAILDLLEASGIDVWLGDGGWGVDALLGEQSRAHDDLDLIVPLDGVPSTVRALAARGYELAGGGAPISFELVDAEGRQVDVHPVAFDETGDGIYVLRSGDEWRYPASGFAGVGVVGGRAVRCLTPAAQVRCHTGYEPDADDVHDMHALAERFGVELPATYRS